MIYFLKIIVFVSRKPVFHNNGEQKWNFWKSKSFKSQSMLILIFLPIYFKFWWDIIEIFFCNWIFEAHSNGAVCPKLSIFWKIYFLENSWNNSNIGSCIEIQSYLMDNKGYLIICPFCPFLYPFSTRDRSHHLNSLTVKKVGTFILWPLIRGGRCVEVTPMGVSSVQKC